MQERGPARCPRARGGAGEQDDARPLGPFRDDELHVLYEISTFSLCGFPDDHGLQRAERKAAAADMVDDTPRRTGDDRGFPLEAPLLAARVLDLPERHEGRRIPDRP